jgi:DNA-directed RNA polymerase omega subunit
MKQRQFNEIRKPLDLSRGPGVDTEVCTINAGGNRFDLVLIASERAREIRRQNKDSDKREHVHSIVTALEEIQAGGIDPRKYLNKVR